MASSENLNLVEQWMRPSLDTWFADYLARDADTLTRALQKSISGAVVPEQISPLDGVFKAESSSPSAAVAAAATPTASGHSGGSDQDLTPRRRGRGASVPAATGKVTKRKSRATKRSHTTFITADAANFRQMVQQVTGVRFSGAEAQVAMAPVMKPEPMRPGCGGGFATGGRLPPPSVAAAGCLLPTLDTSAFLLDHHQQQAVGPNLAVSGPGLSGPGPLPFTQQVGGVSVDAPPPFSSADFDAFSSFPTLESWKVM